jgi:hypothetical protein
VHSHNENIKHVYHTITVEIQFRGGPFLNIGINDPNIKSVNYAIPVYVPGKRMD